MTEYTLPLQTQAGNFESESDIEKWVCQNNTPFFAYDYIYLIRYSPFVYTNFTNECLRRYQAEQKGYKNFSEVIDDVPAWWVDISSLIDNEIQKAQKMKAKNG